MNLINHDKIQMEIKEVFANKLLLISNQMKKNKIEYFPLKQNSNLDTYYIERKKTKISPEDFRLKFNENIETCLEEFWNVQGQYELSKLASIFLRLAKALHDVERQNKDVSPFIYVMY